MTAEATSTSDSDDREFDLDALREKYREEREKRLRTDANRQYREVIGDFAHYVDDPHSDPGFTRDPLHDEVEMLIIGGGFGGLLMAAKLREAGIDDIRVVESGADFGGTWYWNRYPGAQCDIESYIYMPLLEELEYMPTEKYSHGPEILAHAQAIARHYDLYPNACLQTNVTALEWDEASSRWTVRTDREDAIKARFVFMANGPLNRPKLPGIEGVENFKGHSFHTSRWDYDYTGGDTDGGLDRLAGKRVGILGTGATAIQCVPYLAAGAEQLYVFQRTPSSVDVRGNRPTDPEFVASLEPGWHQARMDNFNTLLSGEYQEEDLVGDGWTDIFRNLVKILEASGSDLSLAEVELESELADMRKMEEIRARVASMVDDPDTAESLKPYYRQFCKRPCFHDGYLSTFNRENVELVDTMGHGVERITEKGVVVAGREYELDCLIFATGFEVGTSFWRRAGYDIKGRDGVDLSEKWRDGISTYHGLYSRGFPNCFWVAGLQSGATANIPHGLNLQANHLAYVVRHTLDNGFDRVEPSQTAERDWVELVTGTPPRNAEYQKTCTPGYYNSEGKPGDDEGWFGGMYPEGTVAFFALLDEWRAQGTFDGLEFSKTPSSVRSREFDEGVRDDR